MILLLLLLLLGVTVCKIAHYKYKLVLIEIEGSLKLYDLLQMYEAHPAYQKVIAEDVMKNRALNISEFSENYDVRQALIFLGGFTPEIIIKQSDIQYKEDEYSYMEEIVRLIGQRCSKGNLKKVTIVLDSHEKNANAFRMEIPDVMLSIESLTIEGGANTKKVKCDDFLEALAGHKLSSLTLKWLKHPESHLKILNSEESALRELSIENCTMNHAEFWPEFFEKGIPTLESFTWTNPKRYCTPIKTVDIAKAFPGLKRLRLDVSRKCSLTIGKLPPNLESVELCGLAVFDHDTLDILAALKDSASSIEELSIESARNINPSHKVKSSWREFLRQLTNVRTINFDRSPLDGTDWSNYVHMIELMPSVSTVTLKGNAKISKTHVKTLVQMPCITSIKFQVRVNFSQSLYDLLVTHRTEWHHDSPPLVIHFDSIRYWYPNFGWALVRSINDYKTKAHRIRIQY